MYCAKGADENARVFMAPKYADPLQIKAQFFYEAEDRSIKPLQDDSVLKSGQHVGMAFKAESDCFVYIYWWDSTGQVGRLFPNPELTEGSGEVKAGQTYWLPSMGGERWYVLDQNPGTETLYFVASRQRNEKLERLFEDVRPADSAPARKTDTLRTEKELTVPKEPSGQEARTRAATGEMQRELSLMGFAGHTAPKGVQKVSYETKERLFEQMENGIRISGAEAVFKVQFRHVAQ